jgi:glycosyltransferase involved in cell wall biosynthesis
MYVLHIGNFFPPPYGGIETHAISLLGELNKEIQADLMVANRENKFTSFAYENFNVYQLPSLGLVARASICPTMPFWLMQHYKKKPFDILHIHLPNPMAHLASMVLPAKVKLVVTWHSDIVKQKKLFVLYQPLLNRFLKRSSAIIASTPKHFTSSIQIPSTMDKRMLIPIPYGIDENKFRATVAISHRKQEIKDIYHSKIIIFALGRHIYYKGFEYLIQAIKQLPKNVILLLGGEGPLTSKYIDIINDLGIADRVKLLGKLSNEDLLAYLHACDIFCLPSVEKSEAFGLASGEAMACSKPVVCCELENGVTYLNQHNRTGLVVPPRDPVALANALALLATDSSLRDRLGEGAYEWITTEFSLDKMRNGTLDVYRKVLA